MKSLVLNFIPQIRKSIDILELKTILSLRKWRLYTEDKNLSIYYFFKADGGLIESTNGLVKKASWEYLGNRSILIEGKDNLMLLVNYITHNDKAILLQTEGTSNYIILLNTDYAHLHDLEYEEFMKSLAFFFKEKKEINKGENTKIKTPKVQFIEYEIISKDNMEDNSWGTYTRIEVKLKTGEFGYIYKDLSGYFCYSFTLGKIYCKDTDDAVSKLFYL